MVNSLWSRYFVKIRNPSEIHRNCVDGRSRKQSNTAVYQFPGGDLIFPVVSALASGSTLDYSYILKELKKLVSRNYSICLHRGNHRSVQRNLSDCGFADNLKLVIETLLNKQRDLMKRIDDDLARLILSRLNLEYNPDEYASAVKKLFSSAEKSLSFSKKKITQGEDLIRRLEKDFKGSIVVWDLIGEHKEKAVLLNLSSGTTFDTEKADLDDRQAFNFDLGRFAQMLEEFGLFIEEIKLQVMCAVFLYQAIEIVLVENKGKKSLALEIIY